MVAEIKDRLSDWFKDMRDNFRPVYHVTLRSIACSFAREIGLKGFKASPTWVKDWCVEENVVSRKITRKLTIKDLGVKNFAPELEHFKGEFFNHVEVKQFEDYEIINIDESSYNPEMLKTRTLDRKGAKDVYSSVISKSKTTHSYTLMQAITRAGTLAGLTYLCFQETTGDFGPRIQQQVDAIPYPSIMLEATKSGKLDIPHFDSYLKKLLENRTRVLLILDQWSGHKNLKRMQENNPHCEITLLLIPDGFTSLVQPLDVFFFLRWKGAIKIFWDYKVINQCDEDLTTRPNRAKLHSIIRNQLDSLNYRFMVKHAWIQSGLAHGESTNFKTFLDAGFKTSAHLPCHDCVSPSFIHCAYCDVPICFNHFFVAGHYHIDGQLVLIP